MNKRMIYMKRQLIGGRIHSIYQKLDHTGLMPVQIKGRSINQISLHPTHESSLFDLPTKKVQATLPIFGTQLPAIHKTKKTLPIFGTKLPTNVKVSKTLPIGGGSFIHQLPIGGGSFIRDSIIKKIKSRK